MAATAPSAPSVDDLQEVSPHPSAPAPALACAIGSEAADLTYADLRREIDRFLPTLGPRDDVLLIPPDFTRYHSQAGKITQMICEHYGFISSPNDPRSTDLDGKDLSVDPSPSSPPESKKPKLTPSSVPPKITILPALGTHAPMTEAEIRRMYGDALMEQHGDAFLVHDWRNDVVTIGHAPADMVAQATGGLVTDRPWPAQLNRRVWEKRAFDPSRQRPKSLVLSIGQVVPHEVMGMANFNKNLFVGTGGVEAINLSHFIGACYGMERMMGRQNNPLRDILNYASREFLEKELDLWYILTVVSPDESGKLCIRGLFIGNDIQCYAAACELSLKVNFTMLERPVHRMVTYLDPDEFHSTWLGNKAIYRTRMAMADGGTLIVLAPGVSRFGEDSKVDELIRKHGYKGTPAAMKAMEDHEELQDNLSAVAHLIHGSSEGRFSVTYCPGHLSRAEIEAVGFQFGDLTAMAKRYDVTKLTDGWQSDDEGEFYFISNPALGLWAVQSRFEGNAE